MHGLTRTCATCTESIGSILGLMCVLHARLATEPCEHYEREPGADCAMQVRLRDVAVRFGPVLRRADAKGNADTGRAVPAERADV